VLGSFIPADDESRDHAAVRGAAHGHARLGDREAMDAFARMFAGVTPVTDLIAAVPA
jgi:hypothetical protein